MSEELKKPLAQQANDMLLASLDDVGPHTNRLTVYARINGEMAAIGFALRIGGNWKMSTEVEKRKRQDPSLTLAFGLDF